MYTTSTIVAVLALAAGANAGVCGNINSALYGSNTRQECIAMGCVYSGNRCQQPSECSSGSYVMYEGQRTGVRATRKPIAPEVARLCDANEDCTAIYQVYLSSRWTTGPPNCNDIAMLPPHGVDQTECTNLGGGLRNYTNHPFQNDPVRQSNAKAQNAVTALTQETTRCFEDDQNRNNNCAFPLGYYSDTIKKNKKICVQIFNVQDKWVEIMAASKGGSDASFCVRDRLKDDAMGGDKGCTKAGDLVDIRESGQSPGTDNMFVEFYTEDNFDDASIDFHWRIAASMVTSSDPSSTEDKDAEDWSQYRDGADYPMSLMNPYPEGYDGEPVFDQVLGGSASFTSPTVFVVLVAAIVALLF